MSFGAAPSRSSEGRGGQSRQPSQPEATIQSCAALMLLQEPDLVVTQASDNLAFFSGASWDVIGCRLETFDAELAAGVRARLDEARSDVPVAFRCRVGPARRECDAIVHRPRSGGVAVELEPAGPRLDITASLDPLMQPLLATTSQQGLWDAAAAAFQALTGYDRVLVFRFDERSLGGVVAERRKPGVSSCLGQQFGNAEAPPNAHVLIECHRVRHLVDASEPPVAIGPSQAGAGSVGLDLSGCTWRSMSPIHLQFLSRLGMRGTLVASVVVGGRLWGLIVCHHRRPRFIHYPLRAACELLAEVVATRITALEVRAQAELESAVGRLEARMVESIARYGDWAPALRQSPSLILEPVGATGAMVRYEGTVLTVGDTLGPGELDDILARLDPETGARMISTSWVLGQGAGAVSALAVSMSSGPTDCILWLRAHAAAVGGGHGTTHPSQSVSARGLVPDARCSPPPWSSAERASASFIGTTIADIIHQFRSVRVLIAQAQLAQALESFGLADQPILIADARGRVVSRSPAWDALPTARGACLEDVGEIAALFEETVLAGHHLLELRERHVAWRGHVSLRDAAGRPHPYLIRGDAVLSGQGRALGFVIMLTEHGELAAAQEAERHSQQRVATVLREMCSRCSEPSAEAFGALMEAVSDNATWAAHGLTTTLDPVRGVALAQGVEASTQRTAEVIERLLSYAGSAQGPLPTPT